MCVWCSFFCGGGPPPPPPTAAAAPNTRLQSVKAIGRGSYVLKVRLGVLPGELEKHRVVEELVDRDVLAQALTAPRLDLGRGRVRVRVGGGVGLGLG